MTTQIQIFITQQSTYQECDETVIPFANVDMHGEGTDVDELQHDMDVIFALFKPGSRMLIRHSPRVETQRDFERKIDRIVGSCRFAFRRTEDGSSEILQRESLPDEGVVLYGFGARP